jgi:fused signal recognition particle receptor
VFGLSDKASSDKPSWSERLRQGLARTRELLGTDVGELFARRRVDEALFEELESALLRSDCGVPATQLLIDRLRNRARKEKIEDGGTLKQALKEVLLELIAPLERAADFSRAKPLVVMMTGVNGSGKTTSIGKLAKYFQSQGRSVLLAAGDTFRAAAREQLAAWGERNGVSVIAQQSGDASAVIFDAIGAARARGIDIVLADTAGRLPTQLHLMDEIKKVKRVIDKAMPGAPHEVLLVLDAGTGQNALAQVQAFDRAIGLTGLILTKLDGSAKGGVVAAIAYDRGTATATDKAKPVQPAAPLPLLFVGIGEGIDDLRPFGAREFVEALVD